MASPRRIGAPDAKNRTVLLDAAEQLILEEGYASVTSRRVAQKAGLKSQLVHYYFRTMDDLFLAVFRRRAEEGLIHQEQVLASDQPLRALWDYNTESVAAALTMEFIALANHRKIIRAEIAEYAERLRTQQTEALGKILERYGISTDEWPADMVSLLITAVGRIYTMEKVLLGMSGGHEKTLAFVEAQLEKFEGPRKSAPADHQH
jgi:TetR/AcrR family transcriptional regulator